MCVIHVSDTEHLPHAKRTRTYPWTEPADESAKAKEHEGGGQSGWIC